MRTKTIVFLLAAAVAVSAVYILLRGGGTSSPTARIIRDGVVLEEIDLETVDQAYTFTLEDGRGKNTVQVERGRIRISEADCPDQICVQQGWISDSTVPVVCLPHELIVEILDGGGDLDGGAG